MAPRFCPAARGAELRAPDDEEVGRAMPYSPHQFALFRIALGAYLALRFVTLVSAANGGLARLGLLALVAAALALGLGAARRIAALGLLVGLVWRFPAELLRPGAETCLALLLVACLLVPEGEPWTLQPLWPRDPWRLPPRLYQAAWLLLMLGYSLHGLERLAARGLVVGSSPAPGGVASGLEDGPLAAWLVHGVGAILLSALPLALHPRTRALAWYLTLGLVLGALCLAPGRERTLGLLLAQLFVFDPRFVPARRVAHDTLVFFDGVCGLCNRSVDFLLAEDRLEQLRFAPLQGPTARQTLDPGTCERLDSIVLREGGVLYQRSEAILRLATALGGVFRAAAELGALLPRSARDRAYDWVARHRYRWFGRRESCRVPSAEERQRFVD